MRSCSCELSHGLCSSCSQAATPQGLLSSDLSSQPSLEKSCAIFHNWVYLPRRVIIPLVLGKGKNSWFLLGFYKYIESILFHFTVKKKQRAPMPSANTRKLKTPTYSSLTPSKPKRMTLRNSVRLLPILPNELLLLNSLKIEKNMHD